jgi:hypothetical protein
MQKKFKANMGGRATAQHETRRKQNMSKIDNMRAAMVLFLLDIMLLFKPVSDWFAGSSIYTASCI